MSLVTVARYQLITGDLTTAGELVEECLAEAVELLEAALDRPLEQAERTEQVWPDRAGRLYPAATPIIDAPGWTISGADTLVGAHAWGGLFTVSTDRQPVEVTYTGGWVERTNHPDAPNRLPVVIERDLAWCAWRLARPADTDLAALPGNVTSVRLGDAAITGQGSLAAAATTVTGWSATTLAYRRRVVVGAWP